MDISRRRRDLDDMDKECEIKRDETRDEEKEPLIDDEEWIKIKNYDSRRLETWGQWEGLTPGRNGRIKIRC